MLGNQLLVNISYALARSGAKAGLLDNDIYGHSPYIVRIKPSPAQSRYNYIIPAEKNGIKLVSMGFLADENTPVIWRGPMIHNIIKQFIEQIKWEDLDYLIMDLPPGPRRCTININPVGPYFRSCNCKNSAGCCPFICQKRITDVPKGKYPNFRYYRKYERLCLLPL